MAYATEPRILIPPDEGQTFIWDKDADLAAANVVKLSPQEFVICKYKIATNQVALVRGIHPYLRRRTDVGNPNTESEVTLSENDRWASGGWFQFRVTINGQSPAQVLGNFAAKTVGAAPSNADRIGSGGISWVTNTPWSDALKSMNSPLFWFPVRPGGEIQISFAMMRPANKNAVPGMPAVPPFPTVAPYNPAGYTPVDPTARYDWAGSIICGNLIPAQRFEELRSDLKDAPESFNAFKFLEEAAAKWLGVSVGRKKPAEYDPTAPMGPKKK